MGGGGGESYRDVPVPPGGQSYREGSPVGRAGVL